MGSDIRNFPILEFRCARHWSQREAAAWARVSPTAWRNYEAGRRLPPAPLMRRLIRCGVTFVNGHPEHGKDES